MKYRIRHITEYKYAARVSSCYNLAQMVPRSTLRQTCERNFISVSPHPAFTGKRTDYFGNTSYHFELQRAHKTLIITSESEVEVSAQHSALNLDFGVTCADALSLLEIGRAHV